MKYRRLGMWGVQLSEIGFGSWLNCSEGDEDRACALHRVAYENGINFFDTANAYGGGYTEKVVGAALAPFRRETYVLATKLYWPLKNWPFPGANDRGLSRKHIFEQCHSSLQKLKTDYVDLYQCHRFDEATPLIETCRAMNDIINQGKVLYWGVSEWKADQIRDAVEICDENNWHRPVSDQPLYNMLERHWEADVFPVCEQLGLGVVTFSPLCEGALTGKYIDGIPKDSRAADPKLGQWITPRLTEENRSKILRLSDLARGMNQPLPAMALAWCLRRPEVTSTIIGASKPDQIIENIKAIDLHLDDAILDRIDATLGN